MFQVSYIVSRFWRERLQYGRKNVGGGVVAGSRILRSRLLGLLFLGLAVVASSQRLTAQETGTPIGQARAIELLPPPARTSAEFLLINDGNAPDFKDLIIPELYGELLSGRLQISALQGLRFDWELKSAPASQPQAMLAALAADSLPENAAVDWGALVPFKVRLDDLAGDLRGDPRGQQLLWNIESIRWAYPFSSLNFQVRSLSDRQVLRHYQGTWERAYAPALNAPAETRQLFREMVRVEPRGVVSGFGWLSFRFLGLEEDSLWKYSPIIGKIRPLTGSNRSDPLLAGLFTLDDFFGWSVAPAWVEVLAATQLTALTPVAFLQPVVGRDEGDCRRAEAGDAPRWWNLDSALYPRAAAWSPVGTRFVPRRLLRLDLLPRDPYAAVESQVLYVDAQTWLPVYRFSYGRNGTLLKAVINLNGAVKAADSSNLEPLWLGLAIWGQDSLAADIVDVSSQRYCRVLPPGRQATDFDPRKLKPSEATAPVEPSAAPSEVAPN